MGGRRLHSILEIADCLHLTLRPLAAVPVARSSGDGIIGVWAVSGKGKADFLLKLSFPVYDEYFFKQAALDVGSGTQLGLFLGWACGMARLIAGFPTNAGVVEIFGGDNKGILHHYRCTPGGKAAPIHRVRGSDRRGGDLHCLLSSDSTRTLRAAPATWCVVSSLSARLFAMARVVHLVSTKRWR